MAGPSPRACPIVEEPKWGRIERPGLGVEVDEDKLLTFHEAYREYGEFPPYGDRFPPQT